MPSTVKARWVGPFNAQMNSRLTLKYGDEHDVTPDDLLSEHWEPVGTTAKRAATAAEQKLDAGDDE